MYYVCVCITLDGQPPAIKGCPDDVIVPINSSSSQAAVRWVPPSITDNSGREIEVALECLSTLPADCNDIGEGTFSVGNTTVIYKARDQSGLESVCQFIVEVIGWYLKDPHFFLRGRDAGFKWLTLDSNSNITTTEEQSTKIFIAGIVAMNILVVAFSCKSCVPTKCDCNSQCWVFENERQLVRTGSQWMEWTNECQVNFHAW